jgi:hypothetical protein
MMLAQSATDVLDEVVENRQALLDELLAIITDPQIPDEEIGGLVRGEKIGWDRLRSAIAQAKPRLPRDHGHLAALDALYSYLRQFTPAVLSMVRFAGGAAATELLIAVHMLRELNATGTRKVPEEAPTGFVPTKWRGYLEEARKSGSATAYRLKRNLIAVLLAHQPGSDQDGGGVGHLLRHSRLDVGVVCAGGDAAGGEPGAHRLPPAAPAHRGVRCRHPVLQRRAAVPHPRQVAHRPRVEPLLRQRRPVHVHARHRSARHLRLVHRIVSPGALRNSPNGGPGMAAGTGNSCIGRYSRRLTANETC